MKKQIIDWWAGQSYIPEYQAILDRATTLKYSHPSTSVKSAGNTFLRTLKDAGILSKLDTLKILITNGPANFTDLNWVSPSVYKSTRVNVPTFTRNSGLTFNGSDSYLDLGWKPTDGVNYTQDSCEQIIYYKSLPASYAGLPDGVRDTNDVAFNPTPAAGAVLARSNSGTSTANISNAQFDLTDGLYFFGRTAAGSEFAKKGSGSRVAAANASTTRPNRNLFFGAFNLSGSPALYNTRTIGLYASGGLLTTGQEDTFVTAWNTYLSVIAADTALSTIGTIYNASSWANTSAFTNQGSTVSVVSNALEFSGGAGTFTQSLGITQYTNLQKWTQVARVKVGTKTLTSYGFGLGTRSAGVYGTSSILGRFVMDTGASSGKLILDVEGSPVGSASSALTYSVNDVIELTVSYSDGVITTSAYNVTTASSTVSTSYTFTGGSPYMANIGRFSIYSFGGTFTVQQYTVTSTEYYQPRVMFIGDSKTQRYNATKYGLGYVKLFEDSYGPVVNYGGGYHTTADVLNLIPEITTTIRPQKVVLAIGSNDVRSGVADATMKSNYASIVSQLQAAGITVVHTTGLYETSISQASLQAYINANYSAASVIDSVDTVLTLAGDGIHPIDAGHATFAALLLNSGKI